MESIRFGKGDIKVSRGTQDTIMAGLNCSTPSLLAWPIIRDGVNLFLTISDDYTIGAMRMYYDPIGSDPHITSGESGASGLAALLALMHNDKLAAARDKLNLGSSSRILIFNTEGATDPENFDKLVRV
jgi:diaminopropionate ammonia-lyase